MYNAAFDQKFVPNGARTQYGCIATKIANMTTCPGARMGYFNSNVGAGCNGEYFIATTTIPYYVAPPNGAKFVL